MSRSTLSIKTCFTTTILVLAALASSACGDDTSDLPTAPTPTAIAETFSGTVNINGARIHPFTVTRTGQITATLTAEAPDPTVPLGLDLGTWATTTSTCQLIISNNSAIQATTIVGTASIGPFCVRISDATNTLTGPVDYTVTVTHY